MKVRKKSPIVEAFQFDPLIRPWPAGVQSFSDKDSRVMSAMMDALPIGADPKNYGYLETLDGGFVVRPGDWVITGIFGERYLCESTIFERTYERAPDEPPSELERHRVGS